ncbi:MAG: cysteine hydrolase family protein [Acidobacteria bacterium]|nr:cysteine hydrolase family protein [Acidobacteriota bacterium]
MSPALILIDLQLAIDDPSWGLRNNLGAEANVALLLDHWRRSNWPIVHVRHDSREPNSKYRPGQPLHAFKPETAPLPGETVLGKTTCSAFLSTDLAERVAGRTLVIAGVITNNSVESTVRSAGDLGFAVTLAHDACFTFGKRDWFGVERSADEVHGMTLSNLDGEYCRVLSTGKILCAEETYFPSSPSLP